MAGVIHEKRDNHKFLKQTEILETFRNWDLLGQHYAISILSPNAQSTAVKSRAGVMHRKRDIPTDPGH